jgi:VIT1/CCC1 family predicted Fe2+/Mn2+ transporter
MNEQTLRDGEQLLKRIKILDAALAQAATMNHETYGLYLHTNSDGSGSGINLTGAYISGEIIDAVRLVIAERLVQLRASFDAL